MKSEKLHDWLQLVGMVAIVASLIFVGLQLRQSEDAAQSDLSQSTIAIGVEFSSLMAEHSDIWIRACSGQELRPEEQLIAHSIYFRYLQNNFNSWSRAKATAMGFVQPSFFTDHYAANIHRYPGFKQMAVAWSGWSETGARLDDEPLLVEYRDEVLSRLSELEKAEPSPSTDIAWGGIR